MKYNSSIISLCLTLVLLCLSSCEQSDEMPSTKQDIDACELTLNLQCLDLQTRANTMDGVSGNNENLIKSIDCFLYPANGDLNTQAAYYFSVDKLNKEAKATINTFITNENINKIFGSKGTTCKVYAIVNRPSETTINAEQTSISQLKKLAITNPDFTKIDSQTSFVMDNDGTEDLTLNRDTKQLTGQINLKRSATKITLTITSIQEVVENAGTSQEITWTANAKHMIAQLRYGVKNSYIDTDTHPYKASKQEDYFSFPDDKPMPYDEKTITEGGITSTHYEQRNPFYSYSNVWVENKEPEPYILLVVPWSRSDEPQGNYHPCYYQIPVNSQLNSLERNHYYKINLSISTLGSFMKEEPTPLTPSYCILDWGKNTIEANLQDFRYLMVEHTFLRLNNHNSVEIAYASSHPIKATVKSYTHTDLSQTLAQEINVDKPQDAVSIDETNHMIVYKRDLDNVFENQTFDFTKYTIVLHVEHIDKPQYCEDITLIQYPAIYAEPSINSDWDMNYINNPSHANHNDHHGYVFVNGYYSTKSNQTYTHHEIAKDKQDYFCSAEGFGNTAGSPNMYVFTVTSVHGTNYRIGDPREKEVNQTFINETHIAKDGTEQFIWFQGPFLNNNGKISTKTRRLKHYYATDESESTRNVIAPKFRIASAYAVLNTGDPESRSRDMMKKRCASYQEDGYPAGRWRLPTQAEFEFIISQVAKQKLPQLYINNTSYWCAHGIGSPQSNGTINMSYIKGTSSGEGFSTRCVYDEWYWTDKIPENNKNQFVWGDRERK